MCVHALFVYKVLCAMYVPNDQVLVCTIVFLYLFFLCLSKLYAVRPHTVQGLQYSTVHVLYLLLVLYNEADLWQTPGTPCTGQL